MRIAMQCWLLLFSLAFCSCAGRDFRAPDETAARDFRMELAALPTPEGVNPELFDVLKDGLESKLNSLEEKSAASVPKDQGGKVNTLFFDPESNHLTWDYANKGDYDLSGEVGVSDITPIALNFLAQVTDGKGNDPLERWIDGDLSGEVGIGDITPIAIGFLNSVTAYVILTSESLTGPFSPIGLPVPFGDPGRFPKQYSVPLPEGALGYVAVAAVDQFGSRGLISNVVDVEAAGPPVVIGVSPQSGGAGYFVTFRATMAGAPPFTFEWDFGGGATPDTSTAEEPYVQLGAAGVYSGRVTATNMYSSDSYDFEYTVEPVPPTINWVDPITSGQNRYVTFTADADGSPPLEFSWNFGEMGTPATSSDESPMVLVGDTPGTFQIALTVTNAYGEDVFPVDFEVTNVAPSAKGAAQPPGGVPPVSVNFSDAGSSDADGEIVKWEWDFGDGAGFQDFSGTQGSEIHEYASDGDYTATYRVTDDDGATDEEQFTIKVQAIPSGFWEWETVSSTGSSFGTCGGISVDDDGIPWLTFTFINSSQSDFKVAGKTGDSWQIWTLDSAGTGNQYFGEASAIGIDPTGAPCVVFKAFNTSVMYERWNGAVWQEEIVTPGNYAPGYDFLFNAQNYPSFLTIDKTEYKIFVTYKSGGSWQDDLVSETGWIRNPAALAFESDGTPHVVYNNDKDDESYYSYFSGTAWQTSSITDAIGATEVRGIQVDSAGRALIAYGGGDNDPAMHFATRQGSNWSVEDIPTEFKGFTATRIELTKEGYPCLLAIGVPASGFRFPCFFKKHLGILWYYEAVPCPSSHAGQPDIALDSSGNPHVSFLAESTREARYAHWSPD
jgi:hypothetical protein